MKVIIIGGGASGLVSAITAARNNNEVLILEKNKSIGKKILMTGNGKCNYWNADQDINHYHSENHNLLETYLPNKREKLVLDFFSSIGIVPKIKNGYYYPNSAQASSIVNALRKECDILGISIITDCEVYDIIYNNKFIVKATTGDYMSDKVIISTGSAASIKEDRYKEFYSILEKFGHTKTEVLPSLVQLIGEGNFFKLWDGVRSDASISLYIDNKFVGEETGEIQLTGYGISGICSMQLSGIISRNLKENKKCEVRINFLNNLCKTNNDFIELINNLNKKVANRSTSELLNGILNKKLISLFMKLSNIDDDQSFDKLTSKEKENLNNYITSFNLNIIGTNDFVKAQVVSGGIKLNEVTPFFESKKIPGLYITGEMLDVDGDCGGYNLGFAWISGITAGRSIK